MILFTDINNAKDQGHQKESKLEIRNLLYNWSRFLYTVNTWHKNKKEIKEGKG